MAKISNKAIDMSIIDMKTKHNQKQKRIFPKIND